MDFTPRKSLKLYYHFGVYTKSGKHPKLKEKNIMNAETYFYLFSLSGFIDAVIEASKLDNNLFLIDVTKIVSLCD